MTIFSKQTAQAVQTADIIFFFGTDTKSIQKQQNIFEA